MENFLMSNTIPLVNVTVSPELGWACLFYHNRVICEVVPACLRFFDWLSNLSLRSDETLFHNA